MPAAGLLPLSQVNDKVFILFDKNKLYVIIIRKYRKREFFHEKSINQSINQSINSIIVSYLDFYKKAKDVVSLFKMQIYGVFFILSFSCLIRESFYLVYKVCVANKKLNIKRKRK